MGGMFNFGSGGKTSTTSSTADNSNVAASDSSTAFRIGDRATVNMTDGGAFDLVSHVTDIASQTNAAAMKGLQDMAGAVLGKQTMDSGERLQGVLIPIVAILAATAGAWLIWGRK